MKLASRLLVTTVQGNAHILTSELFGSHLCDGEDNRLM